MSPLFKLPPAPQDADLTTLCARAFYDAHAAVGECVLGWWPETQSGRGLVGHDLCASWISAPGRLTCEVEIITFDPRGFGLGKAELARHRRAPRTTPQATLADKLYRNVHNKAVSLTRDEEDWL